RAGAPQRPQPGGDGARRHPRDARRRRPGHRAGVQLAGDRPVHVPGGDREGLPDRSGRGHDREHPPGDQLPAARSHVRDRGPADQGLVVATAAASAGTVRPAVDARVSRSLWSNAWYKLRHDRLTIAAMAVLVLLAILSILAPVFADNVFHYKFEQQDLFHTYEKPTLDPPA